MSGQSGSDSKEVLKKAMPSKPTGVVKGPGVDQGDRVISGQSSRVLSRESAAKYPVRYFGGDEIFAERKLVSMPLGRAFDEKIPETCLRERDNGCDVIVRFNISIRLHQLQILSNLNEFRAGSLTLPLYPLTASSQPPHIPSQPLTSPGCTLKPVF